MIRHNQSWIACGKRSIWDLVNYYVGWQDITNRVIFIKKNTHIKFKGSKLVLSYLKIVLLKPNIRLYILILLYCNNIL